MSQGRTTGVAGGAPQCTGGRVRGGQYRRTSKSGVHPTYLLARVVGVGTKVRNDDDPDEHDRIVISRKGYTMTLKRRPPPGNVRRVHSTGENTPSVVHSKTGRTVQCESYSERCWLYRLDRDRSVKDYGSQPETFERDGHRYTPDFIVWRWDGRVEIHEITRSSRRTREQSRRREKIAREICAERGWTFFVHTEKDLPGGAELANLSLLIRYRPRAYANHAVADLIFERIAREAPIRLDALVGYVADRFHLPTPDVVSALCHLLWHGDLDVDLGRLLFIDGAPVPQTLVRPSSHQDTGGHSDDSVA